MIGTLLAHCWYSLRRHVTIGTPQMWSRDAILSLRLAGRKLNFEVRETVKRLRCLRRGCRAGRRVQQRTACRTVIETATAAWGIPVISTNRHLLTNSPPFPASFRD